MFSLSWSLCCISYMMEVSDVRMYSLSVRMQKRVLMLKKVSMMGMVRQR